MSLFDALAGLTNTVGSGLDRATNLLSQVGAFNQSASSLVTGPSVVVPPPIAGQSGSNPFDQLFATLGGLNAAAPTTPAAPAVPGLNTTLLILFGVAVLGVLVFLVGQR